MSERQAVAWLVFGSWFFFLASLPFPVFYLSGQEEQSDSQIFGIHVLLIGWMGCCFYYSSVAWYANPLFVAGTVLMLRAKSKSAAAFSTIGMVLAFCACFQQTISTNASSQHQFISHFGLGFYLWLAAIGLNWLSSVGYFLHRRAHEEHARI